MNQYHAWLIIYQSLDNFDKKSKMNPSKNIKHTLKYCWFHQKSHLQIINENNNICLHF